MALLTPMQLDDARALGRRFGVAVAALKPVLRGGVNSNFEVTLSSGGRAFLRVYEESDRAAVTEQNRLLAHLVEGGVPTPAPMRRVDGRGTIVDFAGKPVALFPFCDGDWICQQRVDRRRLLRVGEALAVIHLAGAGYRNPPDNRFGSEQLRARVARLRSRPALAQEQLAAVAMLAGRLDELDALTVDHPLDTVVHGDVFRDNVLWHADDSLSAIIDFESASVGHPAFDLMVTMLAWCYGSDLERPLAQALLVGYQRQRALADDELCACYDQARAAAVRFALTRVTDYELRPAGVVVYKDYRRFMTRLRAIEAIGRERFVEWLGAD